MSFGVTFAVLGLTVLISDALMIAPFSTPQTFVDFSNNLLVYGGITLVIGLIFIFGCRKMSLFFSRKK
jgi:hypothetical protein